MLSTESGFSEYVYFMAARDRMTCVNRMLNAPSPDFVVVSYLAGVAVECLFHAYRMRSGVDDTAKHDLYIHANISGFYDGMTTPERRRIGEYVNEVALRWQNNHRYRSHDALHRYVEKRRLYIVSGQRTTREDIVQFNAGELVEAANQIVTEGILRWTR